MATHFTILSHRTSWTEEPGGLQLISLQSQTRQRQLSTLARVVIWLVLFKLACAWGSPEELVDFMQVLLPWVWGGI